ncbi:MAG: cobalamin biosynthesis protein [Chloroflexi bacterium]|nr:cobalamin biosynthesis protein [Chloroflexota bacterium]
MGIGCNRGVGEDEVQRSVLAVLARNKLTIKSVRSIATIDLKADEPGLRRFAERLGVPVRFFSGRRARRPCRAAQSIRDGPCQRGGERGVRAGGAPEFGRLPATGAQAKGWRGHGSRRQDRFGAKNGSG